MDIVVLAGGLSPERDVSLASGAMIANALMERGHRVLLLDLLLGMPEADCFKAAHACAARDAYHYAVPEKEPDLAALAKHQGDRWVGPNVVAVCKTADIVFLALHGSIGENGQLQAFFDIHGIRYTGTGYAGSLLAMDKAVAKELADWHGIPTPRWAEMETKAWQDGSLPDGWMYPVVVKPCGCGSSVGVSVVETEAEWSAAVAYAAQYEDTLLLEQLVIGREFSVGILGGQALPPIEIIPGEGFYDYANKYQPGMAREVCPAEIDAGRTVEMQQLALRAHKALRLGDYSRVDFMLDQSGRPWFLEANTLPGMTPTSLLPQEAQAVGMSYAGLCDKIVALALARTHAG